MSPSYSQMPHVESIPKCVVRPHLVEATEKDPELWACEFLFHDHSIISFWNTHVTRFELEAPRGRRCRVTLRSVLEEDPDELVIVPQAVRCRNTPAQILIRGVGFPNLLMGELDAMVFGPDPVPVDWGHVRRDSPLILDYEAFGRESATLYLDVFFRIHPEDAKCPVGGLV